MYIKIIFEIEGEKTEITFKESKEFPKEWVAEIIQKVLDIFNLQNNGKKS